MKIAMIANSVSRAAGGLLPAVQRLSQSLCVIPETQVDVIGLQDEFTFADAGSWQPLVPRTFPGQGPAALGFSPGLNRDLSQSDFDIVHQHGLWQFISVAVSRWHRTYQNPYLVSPHGMLDSWALDNSRTKKRIAAFCFQNKNLHQAGCLHALCEAEAHSMRDYGLNNPICIIPNGIDLPSANRLDVQAINLSLSGPVLFPSDRKVLLYLGRIHPKKGLMNLLHAWAQTAQDKGWILAIAGWDQGGHEQELKLLASNLGLSWMQADNLAAQKSMHHSLVFLGPMFNEAKLSCYEQCDAFILPSFSEGLPMVVLEAWAHGKPVLMTPQCNLPEGFAAEAAVRIDPSIDSIAEGLTQLFHLSGDALRLLGNNGRRLAETRFTWAKVAADIHAVYRWLRSEGPEPDCIMS